jgi:hypothetical protein
VTEHQPRTARPGDYPAIAAAVDDWWGRPVLGALARADGRTTVSAVTAPANTDSIAFHQAMGFSVTGPVAGYNGPGRDLVRFERAL